MDVFPEIVPGVCLLRCGTAARLKYEVEYGSKRGSSDNCYLMCTGQVGKVHDGDMAWLAVVCQLTTEMGLLEHAVFTHALHDPGILDANKHMLRWHLTSTVSMASFDSTTDYMWLTRPLFMPACISTGWPRVVGGRSL